MTSCKTAYRYSPKVRARAARMVFEYQGLYEAQAGAIARYYTRDLLYSLDLKWMGQVNERSKLTRFRRLLLIRL